MLKNILLDLDDTLLNTNMDSFLPHYFKALGAKMKKFMPPDALIALVLESTYQMMNNFDSERTNKMVFDAHFFPNIPYPEKELAETINDFYENDFPLLEKYVNAIPGIRSTIDTLFLNGYKVVIATNPLFPARAIEHRIDWAGLAGIPFDLVTSYENSHFCKPNPLYYNEILENLNARPDQTIMVGDSEENDILPAKKAGLYTFRIGNSNTVADEHGSILDGIEKIVSGKLIFL